MGFILINYPDIADGDLLFDEVETRQILKFFWPEQAVAIDQWAVDSDVRRFAQTAFIAAIDGSYGMGFIEALGRTIVRPGANVKSLAKKLARRFVRHWWKHVRQQELEDAKIYEAVRGSIARNLARRMQMLKDGVASTRALAPVYALDDKSQIVWT